MKDRIANFAISEVTTEEDFKHPLLRYATFVFADDKPNGNNQGIEYEDFEDVKKTAVDSPIKMKYLGQAGAGGHLGSVTIGHIKNIDEDETEDGVHRLIAKAVLYAGEYPQEVKYLEEAFAEGKAPGASWEVVYKDVKKDGPISWLKKIITSAATFVGNPAYGTRTALLALASSNEITDEQLNEGLIKIIEDIRPKNENKGGSNKVDEDLKKLQAELEEKNKEIERLTAENTALTTAKAELEDSVKEKDETIATFQRDTLIKDRTAKVAEAGLEVNPTDLERKQTYWASLSEEAFAEYLEDIKSVAVKVPAKDKKAEAALTLQLPRPNPKPVETITIEELKGSFRNRNRGIATE